MSNKRWIASNAMVAICPSDRVMCTSETTEGDGVPPSYVELLTCLQGQLLAKKLDK